MERNLVTVGQVGAVPLSTQSGDVGELAGKYRLIAELGQGGMARVFLAVAQGADAKFRKLAVVKMLRPEIAIEPEFNEMFLEEARLCARLNHPNIVQTYDVGVDNGRHLIAMEFLQGVSMHAAVAKLGRNGGPLTTVFQANILLKVLEGLRYAHELKDYDGKSLEIVHRDISPHNIFLTYDGQVKLLDFGIAKAATSNVHTATGVIKGKLTYMAPEQALGIPVDARADLYPVGVMLWQAISGRRRWPAGLNEAAILTRLGSGDPPESPDAVGHGLPAEFDAITAKALAPAPDARFKDAGEFIEALEGVLRTLPPVNPRALGAMLSEAFAEDRQRLQDVIEQQFRLLQAGRTPEPHLLPTLPPPRSSMLSGSGSSSMQTGLDPQRNDGAIDIAIPIDSGTQSTRGLSTSGTLASARRRGKALTLVAVVAATFVTTAGAIAFLYRGQAPHAGAPAPSVAVTSLTPSPSASPAVAETRAAPSASVSEVASPSDPSASGPHANDFGHAHGGPWPGQHGSSRTPPTASSATAAVETPPQPAPPAPSQQGGLDGLIRRPADNPKVKLDTDNPFAH
jgi:serine/threonine-protein kinase